MGHGARSTERPLLRRQANDWLRVDLSTYAVHVAHFKGASILNAQYRLSHWKTDPDLAGVWVGEATGFINDIPPAGDIVERIVREAEACLRRSHAAVV